MPFPFKAILFDLDGTLVDTLPFIFTAFQETFRRFSGVEYTPAEITAMFGPSEVGMIYAHVPADRAAAALEYFYERYAALHPMPPEPFPGVTDLLRELRARGVLTGIVTGKGERSARISLATFGLEGLYDALATGSPAGGEKPRAIAEVLAGWGLPAQAAAYVGDMASDMAAARQAGVTALGAAWSDDALISDRDGLVFHSVAELQAWLLGDGSAWPVR